MAILSNHRIALLVADGFEQVELTSPRDALRAAGATVDIVSPSGQRVRGWDQTDWGQSFEVDRPLEQARGDDYDALVLPGGVMNPDDLRTNKDALRFVRHFFENEKPVGAICHGPWTLVDAGVAEGRRMTSYGSIQTDLRNAGVEWVDEPVVIDGNLITSRRPDDLEQFNAQLIESFAAAPAARQ